jgi:hypothetical protein
VSSGAIAAQEEKRRPCANVFAAEFQTRKTMKPCFHFRVWRLLAAAFLAGNALAAGRLWAAPVLPGLYLSLDGTPTTDTLDSSAFPDDNDLGRYWWITGAAGQNVTISVERLEAAYDPYLWVFQGQITDTDFFLGGFGENIDAGDPGYLDQADDGGLLYPPDGEPNFNSESFDVLLTFALPTAGDYTLIVTSGPQSGVFDDMGGWDPNDGGDGLYDYRISAIAPVAPGSGAVPEPSTAILLGLGLVGWASARLRSRIHGRLVHEGQASSRLIMTDGNVS